jgi:hypothetical protein
MVTAAAVLKMAHAARTNGCGFLYLMKDIPMAPWAAWRGCAWFGRAGAFLAILLDVVAQDAETRFETGPYDTLWS